jgi:hypothetical protein
MNNHHYCFKDINQGHIIIVDAKDRDWAIDKLKQHLIESKICSETSKEIYFNEYIILEKILDENNKIIYKNKSLLLG